MAAYLWYHSHRGNYIIILFQLTVLVVVLYVTNTAHACLERLEVEIESASV